MVYCLIADPEQVIQASEFNALQFRPMQKRGLFGRRIEAEDTPLRLNSNANNSKPSKTGAGALTGKEAADLREPFIAALKDDIVYLDKGLWWYSKDETQPQIWSNMANEEIEVIANVLLRRAQRDPATAHFVRNVVELNENISLFVILGPRLIKTGQQLGKRPKRTQKVGRQ